MQLEEEVEADGGRDPESDDPDGIKGVTEEFMVLISQSSERCSGGWEILLPL